MDNLFHLLLDTAQLYPNHTFVVSDKGERYSFQQLLGRVQALVDHWEKQGVKRNSLVWLSESDPVRTVEMLLAAWALECSVMLAAPASYPFVEASLLPLAIPSVIAYEGQVTFRTAAETWDQIPRIIVFTSGTAGRPKGVMLTHRNVLANAQAISRYITLNADDRALVVKSLYHIATITGKVVLALLSGSSLYFTGAGKSIQYLAQYLNQEKITYIDTVATLWRYISHALQATNSTVGSLRFLSVTGEHVSPSELAAFKQYLPEAVLLYAYGQTEAGPIIGEVLVKSPSVMHGYWNNAELTVEKLQEGWLHTGDMGYIDEDGFLYLLGRLDDRIIRAGQTIYTQEIEDAVRAVDWVRECLVQGEPDPMHGQKIVAYVVPYLPKEAARAALYQSLRSLLPAYLIPQEIRICFDLPTTQGGKLQRERMFN
jgi:long-chain acyl-CoA synthetase